MDKQRKIRVDQLLVKKGLVESRETAQRLILAGKVKIGDTRASKPGQMVKQEEDVQVMEGLKYVSRGGWKLEKALDDFNVNVSGKVTADIGASTGGFTDCLLQREARLVYAVDVGYGQLAWRVRQHPHVVVMDRLNARSLTPEIFSQPIDLAVIDVSFISLSKILAPLLKITEEAIALIKPQFEAGPADVPRGGIIRDPKIHRKVLQSFYQNKGGWDIFGLIESPIEGSSGNREFLVHLKKNHGGWTEQEYLNTVLELTS